MLNEGNSGRVVFAGLFLSLLVFAGCANSESSAGSEAGSNAISVVASVYPLGEISKAVGGNLASVSVLVPAGMEPHTFEPRPSDIKKISDADIVVAVGRGFESWLFDLVKGTGKDDSVLELRDRLKLLVVNASGELAYAKDPSPEITQFDPHVWLDIGNDKLIAGVIAEMFSSLDPSNKDYYEKQKELFIKELDSLDTDFQQELKNCQTRHFVVAGHSAFAYLAKRYGLVELAIKGNSPDEEPSAKRVSEIIKDAERENIRAVFVEPLENKGPAYAIASQINASVLVLDPLGVDTGSRGFLERFRQNLESLKEGLGCRAK